MRSVLRHREFRLLWAASSASTLGDRIVLAANAIPLVLFVLIGGVWADRLERHRVMVVTDVVPRDPARHAGGSSSAPRRSGPSC